MSWGVTTFVPKCPIQSRLRWRRGALGPARGTACRSACDMARFHRRRKVASLTGVPVPVSTTYTHPWPSSGRGQFRLRVHAWGTHCRIEQQRNNLHWSAWPRLHGPVIRWGHAPFGCIIALRLYGRSQTIIAPGWFDCTPDSTSAIASAGVLHPSVWRGLPLMGSWTRLASSSVTSSNSVPLGKNCLMSSLVFSLVPFR